MNILGKKLILSFPKRPGMDLSHGGERTGKGSALALFILPSLLWPSQEGIDPSSQTFSEAGAGEAPCLGEDVNRLVKSKGNPTPYSLGRDPEEQSCLACYISVSVSLSEKQVQEFLVRDLRGLCLSRSIL